MRDRNDIREEVIQHLTDRREDLRASGMSEAEADAEVATERNEFDGRNRRASLVSDAAADLRYAARLLRKNAAFAAVIILTLGLGIGANTALFSIVNGVLLKPLPYPHPDRLVVLHESKQNFPNGSISFPNFRDWRDRNRTFAAMAVSRGSGFTLTGRGDAEQLRAQLVSADFFSILDVQPVAGRFFRRGEDEIGAPPIAVISEGFWRRTLGGSPSAIGHSLTLDGRDYVIVGIVPAGFDLPLPNFRAADIYVPIGLWANNLLNNRASGLGIHGIGRLRSGASIEQARADLQAVTGGLTTEYPDVDKGIGASIGPLAASIVGGVQPYLLLLFGAVVFVLLIACVNVSNLQLVRAIARQREFAVRAALGAGRARLLRQLVVESVVLSSVGGALGLILANAGTRAALAVLPTALPRAADIGMDGRVLAFTAIISVLAGVLFGLAPAWRAANPDLQDALRDGGRGATGARQRAHGWLVVAETALAVVLLVGAGLMVRTIARLWATDIGFQTDRVVTFGANLAPSMNAASPDAIRAAHRQLHDAIASTPGAAAAAFSWGALPMAGDDEAVLWMEGQPKPASANDMLWALRYVVEPEYFAAMRISLIQGRLLSTGDRERTPLVAGVDEVFARKFFGEVDPVGRRINVDMYDTPVQIVGVVRHVNQWGFDSDATQTIRAQLYLAFMQLPDGAMRQTASGVSVIVRGDGSNTGMLGAIRRSIASVNNEQVMYAVQPLEQIVAASVASRRFVMIVLLTFAATALALAALGIYGVLAHIVRLRTHELGIRVALGASSRDLMGTVLARGLTLASAGVAIGLAAAAALTRLMGNLLFGVSPVDPATFSAAALLLLTVALIACAVPAVRATRADPLLALRSE